MDPTRFPVVRTAVGGRVAADPAAVIYRRSRLPVISRGRRVYLLGHLDDTAARPTVNNGG